MLLSPSPVLATAVALIMNKSKMLVCKTSEGILELPGLKVTSQEKALQNLEAFLKKLDLGKLPQQTLYLSQLSISEARKRPVPVIIRIIHTKTAEVPSFLDGTFKPISTLRAGTQTSSLTQVVACWLSE
jgi:hypothetical protein